MQLNSNYQNHNRPAFTGVLRGVKEAAAELNRLGQDSSILKRAARRFDTKYVDTFFYIGEKSDGSKKPVLVMRVAEEHPDAAKVELDANNGNRSEFDFDMVRNPEVATKNMRKAHNNAKLMALKFDPEKWEKVARKMGLIK